jgi:hypothetical protein
MIGSPRGPLLLAALLAALQAALLVSSARGNSDTVDEDAYLPAAGILWAHRDFSVNLAPALPKWAFALAMRAVDRSLDDTPPTMNAAEEYVLWYGGRSRLERVLMAARLTTVAVTVLAGLALWRTASRWGPASGLVAHALWCFSPTVLAAGALATLDAWLTAMVVGLTWATVRIVERPSGARALTMGLFSGLALACKVTALGAIGVAALAGAWAVGRRDRDRGGRPIRVLAFLLIVVLGASITLWVVYGFTFGPVRSRDTEGIAAAIAGSLPAMPFPVWIQTLLAGISTGTRGHRSYLFGQTSTSGWWWFYLANLALKTTIGAQALGLLLFAARLARRPRGHALLADVGLLAYPVLLIVAMSAGRAQLGIRYILPAFPGVMLWAGRTFPALASLVPPWGARAGTIALLAGIVGSVVGHPHYLMFFNSWAGGLEQGPRYLLAGDAIGQDQKRLGEWQAQQGLRFIYYTWYSGRPEIWGVSYADPPCRSRAGVYALEVTEVHRPRRIEAGCLDWLTADPPDDRIGSTIYLYQVTRDRARRLRRECRPPHPFWRRGPPPETCPSDEPAAGLREPSPVAGREP